MIRFKKVHCHRGDCHAHNGWKATSKSASKSNTQIHFFFFFFFCISQDAMQATCSHRYTSMYTHTCTLILGAAPVNKWLWYPWACPKQGDVADKLTVQFRQKVAFGDALRALVPDEETVISIIYIIELLPALFNYFFMLVFCKTSSPGMYPSLP